jgi:hypothetical protein
MISGLLTIPDETRDALKIPGGGGGILSDIACNQGTFTGQRGRILAV